MRIKALSFALIAALAVAPTAMAHDNDKDHKDHVSQSFDFTGFDAIDVQGVYDMDVRVGPDFSIDVSGSKKEMDNIDVYVKGDTLYLARKKKRNNSNGVDVMVTLPRLTDMDVSGVGDFDVEGINGGNFDIDISGVGEVTLDGRCDRLKADVSGVGELDAKRLKCRDVDVNLSGVGEATVYASESIEADASGIGGITVYGKPKSIDKDGTFLSKVKIK